MIFDDIALQWAYISTSCSLAASLYDLRLQPALHFEHIHSHRLRTGDAGETGLQYDILRMSARQRI